MSIYRLKVKYFQILKIHNPKSYDSRNNNSNDHWHQWFILHIVLVFLLLTLNEFQGKDREKNTFSYYCQE